ncbi:MAG TPA: hypothetical protein VE734_07175 [Terriglobales bacterium]|nr:hypothetical protein [Terriglobales bacterium]
MPTNTAPGTFSRTVAGMWKDRGHAGAYIVAADDRRVPDLNTGHIGDRVERPRR